MQDGHTGNDDAFYRAIFEQAALGMACVDLEGRILQCNDALAKFLESTADDLRGQTFDSYTHPNDRAPSNAVFDQLIAGSRTSFQLEKRYVLPSGAQKWGRVTVSLARDGHGRPFTVGMIEDISQRKALEEQLLEAQKMEGIGRLAGGVAHDFNNLLTAISGYAELAQDLIAEDHPSVSSLEHVREAASLASTLTRQLLAFARRQRVDPKIVDPSQLLGDLQQLLGRVLGRGIDIETDISADIGTVRADPGQIEQVAVNLCVNARDAMPIGGRITFGVHRHTVDDNRGQAIDLPPGDYVALSVRDTGMGMTPEVLSHAFEPFFTTKPRGKGTGLGLSTCYGIVRAMGGHLSAESESGQGSTFTVLLPELDSSPDATIERHGGPPGQGEIVLLVEDDELVRGSTAHTLTKANYRVDAAGSPAEALEKAAAQRPAVVVADIAMPDLSGPDLVERLRERLPDLRVLYVSGFAETPELCRDAPEELRWFLAKPFSRAQLLTRLRTAITE